MADDDMQQHLNNSIYGPPQTNPDERRHYLGSLRERVAIRVKNQDVERPEALTQVTAALTKYAGQAGYKLLLNGKLDPDMTAPYMKVASAYNLPFTLVNDATANVTPQGSAVLLVASGAINVAAIDVPTADDTPAAKAPKKSGLFGRLFK